MRLILGALPSVNRKETFRDNHIDMRQGDYKNIFNKKLETPKATVLVINNGQCAYTLKNQIMMSMLSQILNIMYTESVREKEGGTYGVSAFRQSDQIIPKRESGSANLFRYRSCQNAPK